MATPTESSSVSKESLLSKHALTITVTLLALGLFTGYFVLGLRSTRRATPTQVAAPTENSALVHGGHPKLTVEQMKQMAEVQASQLIKKSETDPKNAGLLVQIAGIYQATHQFKEAAGYFDRALKVDPKNVAVRTQMATCLYYGGDVDKAVAQLDQALQYNPIDANSLFNLGMIKYRGKNDPAGAIAAWRQLLKTSPNLDRKPMVEKMIAEAQSGMQSKSSTN